MQATFMSLLIGVIFLNVGETDPAVPRVRGRTRDCYAFLVHSCPHQMYLLYFASLLYTESPKQLWCPNYMSFYEHHGNSVTYVVDIPSGTPRVPSRIFYESLFCVCVLSVTFSNRGICYSNPDIHHGELRLLHMRFMS